MLKVFFKSAAVERASYYIDKRALCLHAALVGSMQDNLSFAEKVYEDFLLALKPVGLFGSMTDERQNVKIERLLDTFRNEFEKWGESQFISDFFLKTDRIRTKKDLKEQENKLLAIAPDFLYEQKVFDAWFRKCEKYAARFPESERKEILVKELLHSSQDVPGFCGNFEDARIWLSAKKYGTPKDLYKVTLSVRIQVASLGEHVNAAADYLRKWLEDVSEHYACISGFVGKGALSGQFVSPQMEYFAWYEDGIVESSNGDRYGAKEWMEVNFAEGIEWANVFSPCIVNKIRNAEKLKSVEGVEMKKMKSGSIAISSKKNFRDFSAEEAKKLYPYLEGCLRPGNVTIKIKNLSHNLHDLPIPESWYRIEGDSITFSRGNFEFITSVSDETALSRTEAEGFVNCAKICEMLSSAFDANCVLFQKERLSMDDVEKMMREAEKNGNFPLIFCVDTPIMEHLDSLSQSNEKLRKNTYIPEIQEKDNVDDDEILEDVLFGKDRLKEAFQKTKNFFEAKADNHCREYLNIATKKNNSMIWMETKVHPLQILEMLGFNECLQIPFFRISKSWYTRYGAIPTVIGQKAVEYRLKTPVSENDAIDLAIEHFQYAPYSFEATLDLETAIFAYARQLTQSTIWHMGFV